MDAEGYVRVYLGDGREAMEHRLVMETELGRRLGPDEVVHHIDQDKRNNDPSNLMVMSPSEHIRLHHFLWGHCTVPPAGSMRVSSLSSLQATSCGSG